MDVSLAIDELRSVRDSSERLHRIGALRERYRREASAFTPEDVELLRGLVLEARISELEQTARRCRRGHKMMIREGARGYFWGCGAYPFCHHASLLTKQEWEYLHAGGGRPPVGLAHALQLPLV